MIKLQPMISTVSHRLASEIIALLYMVVVVAMAVTVGPFYILFPELGALSYDALSRPQGHWCRAPLHLATSPALAGVIGLIVTRRLPYGLPSVLLIVAGVMILIEILKSPIAPAISAGLLPLVLGITSWWYPPGILLGSVMLTALSILWKRFGLATWPEIDIPFAAEREPSPPFSRRLGIILAFTVVAASADLVTGLRFILFPPLLVIAYEMFGHPASCPWAIKPMRLPLACTLTAAAGFAFYKLLGVGPAAAACSMAAGMFVLRILELHVPPALAVAFLPMLMDSPTIAYPFAVGIGTSLLSMYFLAYQKLSGGVVEPAPVGVRFEETAGP